MKQLRDKERDRKTEIDRNRSRETREKDRETEKNLSTAFLVFSALENVFTVLIMWFLIHVI